ncbi:MAG: carbohydrate ABC transporter permease [Treponema sp.]|jgi:raffinose/stachyose/melibiose transport system permease protein|nr:carbohydrate ABC transporter permease [Treponema sp.]
MDVRNKDIPVKIAIYIVMLIFAVLAIYPLLWMFLQSFKTTQEFMGTNRLSLPQNWFKSAIMGGNPDRPWQGNYPYAWKQGNFTMLFMNSIIYTVVTVASVVILSAMAGFAFSKIPSKATPVFFGVFIIGILLTLQSIMVPLFLMVNAVGLYNTRLGILIPYIGLGLPMGVYLSTDFVKSVPDAVIESARIDGAKYLKIFSTIILPMIAPVAMTIAILTFSGTWNEFMLINILASSGSGWANIKSLPVGINMFSGALASDYGKQFAALTVGAVPMIAFYLAFRKQITKGVAAGAVKG